MGKLAAGLLALALLLSAVFMGHGLATGIAVPYTDPTPEQAAHERYHSAISEPLFIAAVATWLVAGAVSAVCAGRWAVRTGRA